MGQCGASSSFDFSPFSVQHRRISKLTSSFLYLFDMFCKQVRCGVYGNASRRGDSDKRGATASIMVRASWFCCYCWRCWRFMVFVVPSVVMRFTVLAALFMFSCCSLVPPWWVLVSCCSCCWLASSTWWCLLLVVELLLIVSVIAVFTVTWYRCLSCFCCSLLTYLSLLIHFFIREPWMVVVVLRWSCRV